jgi:hypothetical protein
MNGEIIGRHRKHVCSQPDRFGDIEIGDVWRCGCGKTWVAYQDAHDGYMPRMLANRWRREHFWETFLRWAAR